MQATTMRETQINIRLGPDEKKQFDVVADHLGVNIPTMLRLLVKHAAQDLARKRRLAWQDDEPSWERDKRYAAFLVPLVNRFMLEVIPDDAKRTFTIHSPRVPPVGARGPLTLEETIEALENWEGGDILRIDPFTRVVTYSPSRSGRVEEAVPSADAVDEATWTAIEQWKKKNEAPEANAKKKATRR